GSIRMEPVFMVLGQSAATAAVQAIEANRSVQQIDYARLADRLRADEQVLDFPVPPLVPSVVVDPRKLAGVVVDDVDAERTGFGTISMSASPYVQACYRHDGNTDKGSQVARFVPTLPVAGRYDVRVAYSPSPNRATNVPVTVRHADGTAAIRINQRKPPNLDRAFVRVGTYRFEKGTGGWVEISNAGTDGYVVIDAVQFVPVE
ncbi:MAG: FAD-dependent oxidoreductase, partial [Pirellulales bacterium]